MSALSDYSEGLIHNKVLNAYSDTEWPAISSIYVALFTATPSDAGGGTEVSGGSYARVQVTAGFTVGTTGHAENTSDISFPTATASWGTVTSWGAYDASSGGNLLAYGTLGSSKSVASGAQVRFLAGELQLDFSASGFLSDYVEEKALNRLLNAQTDTNWPVISSVYVAAMTAAPDDSGGGTEASGGSYARVQVTADFTVSSGSASNASAISFPQATASWGTITHVAIYDASSGGNLLIWGALDESKSVDSGGQLRFAIGGISLTLD